MAKEEKTPRRDGAWVMEQLTRWDLTGEGARPFRLTAKLDVLAETGWVRGTYAITWASPDRWREELHFPGHGEMEGMAGDVRWRMRPTRYRPRLPWLLTAPVRDDRFSTAIPQTFRQPKQKDGLPALACLGQNCVDVRTGELRTAGIHEVSLTFEAPADFPLRAWPASYRMTEEGREIGRATIEMLEPLPAVHVADFDPRDAAVRIPACGRPTAPRLILSTKVKPPYPVPLRQQHVEGFVRIRATIADDGKVQEIEVSRAAHPQLADLALAAVRQWRYEPAQCGARPVPVEVWLKVDWDLK
jgi:TonB family protein